MLSTVNTRTALRVYVVATFAWACTTSVSADCTIEYRVEAVLQVTDSYLGKGDTTVPRLPGTLVVSFERLDDGQVSDGKVKVLHFSMFERFSIDAMVDVTTVSHHFAPACNGETEPRWRRPGDPGFPEACRYEGGDEVVAVGKLSRSERTIEWARCNAADTYWSPDEEAYTPAAVSRGRGCLQEMHVVGNVHCDGRLGCRFGGLSPGDNPQYAVWAQPLVHGPPGSPSRVEISSDLSTIRTPRGRKDGYQSYNLPNDSPTRTWFSFVAKRNDQSSFTTCP